MQQSSRRRPAHMGTKIFITVGLLLLLTGIGMFISMIHLQLQWKQFQIQMAACTYEVGTEEGYLKATSETETASVIHKNAYSVFSMVQTAKAGSIGKLRKPAAEQIALEYSCGAYGILSLTEDDRVHISLTDTNGKLWNFYLGRCNYRSLEKLLSIQGAAVENAPWTD